jgi:hypothetical protein
MLIAIWYKCQRQMGRDMIVETRRIFLRMVAVAILVFAEHACLLSLVSGQPISQNIVYRSRIGIYRPADGRWYIPGWPDSIQWGEAGGNDIPVPGFYDENGNLDLVVWRPSDGTWYLRKGTSGVQWGTEGDIPVPSDYLGLGYRQLAVWRPSDGIWYIHGQPGVQWGQKGDIPVPADYNGDGKAERVVWRPGKPAIWCFQESNQYIEWGTEGDIPVPADYFGTGRTQIAVWRPAEGKWLIKDAPEAIQWGQKGDVSVPARYALARLRGGVEVARVRIQSRSMTGSVPDASNPDVDGGNTSIKLTTTDVNGVNGLLGALLLLVTLIKDLFAALFK